MNIDLNGEDRQTILISLNMYKSYIKDNAPDAISAELIADVDKLRDSMGFVVSNDGFIFDLFEE